MREISKWAVERALSGAVPRRHYSYTKDNTRIQNLSREYRQLDNVPWEYRSAHTHWRPSHTVGENEVLLFGNKILHFTAVDGKLCALFPMVHWTMAGHDTVTTRERLNAFGIKLVRKRGKTFWYKPNGEIEEVDPTQNYTIHGKDVISYCVANNILARYYLDYIVVVRNRRRLNK